MSENTIDRLEIQIQSQAQKANADLDKMISKLEKMTTSLERVNNGGVNKLSNCIDRLSTSMKSISDVKTAEFSRLAKNIDKIGSVNQSGINNTANALRQISSALTATSNLSSGATQIAELANGISRLGYKSVTNAIANLPLLAIGMKQFMQTLSTAPQVSQNLIQMTNAMSNLASQGSKYNATIKSISSATNRLTKSHSEAMHMQTSFINSLSKLMFGYYILKNAITSALEPINEAMDFGETINLFQTSFKKIGMEAAEESGMEWGSNAADSFALGFVDRAQQFTDKITDALSLDPNTIMNYQAVFAQMSNAFGLTTNSVMNLSESFTMLGLDIASFFNTDVESAMVKLRAGLAGETEPLRALGVDITENTLKMIALKYGIDDSVSSMSQAAKTQLRWLAIMDQTETVFGDMAKTVESPANQVRILQQQFENLSRSIGTIFLPVISQVLPYVNAFLIVIRRFAETIANAMGYELPDYTDSDIYTDISGDIGSIGDAADDSTDSVNKLSKSLSGFDKLNVLSESSTKGISVGSGSGYLELDDAIANKTESYMEKFNQELGNMKNQAEELADLIQPKIEKFIEVLGEIAPLLAGIAAAFVTYKVIDWLMNFSTSIGKINPTAGVAALFVLGIVAVYEAIKKYNEALVKEDLAKRFGEISLSMEEVKDIAEELTTSKYTANIDIYVTEKQKLSEIEKNIQTDIESLNKFNWKVSVGLALTEGEAEQYKSTIEKFISDSEAYIEQQHYVTTLAVNAVIQDTAFRTEISQLVDDYFSGSQGEMERLGKQLRQSVDDAFADGVLDAGEQKVIDKYLKEYNEINSRIADAQFKAKLQMITIDGDLTPESFKDLTGKIQETISERAKQAEEASYTVLTVINDQYTIDMQNATTSAQKKKIKNDFDREKQGILDELSKTKAIVTLDGLEFSLGSLTEKYQSELNKVTPKFASSTKETLEPAVANQISKMDTKTAMGTLVSSMTSNYQTAIAQSGMSQASQTGLKQMLAALEPSKEQLQKIYDDALETGNAVPAGVSAALTDIANLGALTGDMDSIAFLIGQKLSTDPTYLELLSKAENAGADLDANLVAGLKSGIPDLKKQGTALVYNVNVAVRESAKDSKANHMPGYAGGMIKGFADGFNNDKTLRSAVSNWLSNITDLMNSYRPPSLKISSLAEYAAENGYSSKTTLTIGGYATGGQPNTGEIFAARENGITEMIGRIGNKATVANNDQITDGIASAVENAIISTLLPALAGVGGSGNGDTIVSIDGKEVFRATQKQAREFYKSTNISPFPV